MRGGGALVLRLRRARLAGAHDRGLVVVHEHAWQRQDVGLVVGRQRVDQQWHGEAVTTDDAARDALQWVVEVGEAGVGEAVIVGVLERRLAEAREAEATRVVGVVGPGWQVQQAEFDTEAVEVASRQFDDGSFDQHLRLALVELVDQRLHLLPLGARRRDQQRVAFLV